MTAVRSCSGIGSVSRLLSGGRRQPFAPEDIARSSRRSNGRPLVQHGAHHASRWHRHPICRMTGWMI
jgi:hypothetical protein